MEQLETEKNEAEKKLNVMEYSQKKNQSFPFQFLTISDVVQSSWCQLRGKDQNFRKGTKRGEREGRKSSKGITGTEDEIVSQEEGSHVGFDRAIIFRWSN